MIASLAPGLVARMAKGRAACASDHDSLPGGAERAALADSGSGDKRADPSRKELPRRDSAEVWETWWPRTPARALRQGIQTFGREDIRDRCWDAASGSAWKSERDPLIALGFQAALSGSDLAYWGKHIGFHPACRSSSVDATTDWHLMKWA